MLLVTNILLSKTNTITLIDMRGVLGDTCTLKGDVVYNLGKIYQTLMGYDFLLHQGELTENDNAFLKERSGVNSGTLYRRSTQLLGMMM